MLGATSIALVLCVHSKAQPPSSVKDSPTSATRASDEAKLVNSCAAAVEELIVIRKLVTALENENASLRERLETAAATEAVLIELKETREKENYALHTAIGAKNETIAAKDASIKKQDEMISELRRRKSSVWKRVGDILIGVAISSVLR